MNRVRLRLGLSDGQQTEVLDALEGAFQEGAEPVTSFSIGPKPATRPTGGNAFPGLGGGRGGGG